MVFTLARASMDGALLVVAIWAAIWLLDRVLLLSPATRAMLWWCAAAKFVVALTWTTPIAIPICLLACRAASSWAVCSDAV